MRATTLAGMALFAATAWGADIPGHPPARFSVSSTTSQLVDAHTMATDSGRFALTGHLHQAAGESHAGLRFGLSASVGASCLIDGDRIFASGFEPP